MDTFWFYVKFGFDHISDLAGYDHILFLVVLCAVYRIEQWRKILWLVTAFTLGHSITLFLVLTDILRIPSNVISVLIPMTILITAFSNVLGSQVSQLAAQSSMKRNYFMALFFGLIHGMDFSNSLRSLLMGSSNLLEPLFGFNIGIELGQLLIVLIITGLSFLFLNIIRVKHREWNLFISGAAAGMALISIAENL
ncbi:HupE/UreJ family protein [Aureicoccus marinus]|uniref:HupE / UreJ protein n=1 Tax=Aureicoccus marinus TaxID=754435 RepID=A0A2S7T5S2_9FLAO|nr:HupE/UreJ family protein [Aureicoccus marinus]PQJ14921.1 hypothetical protein BST99_03480 [Aureicoccus marinus]